MSKFSQQSTWYLQAPKKAVADVLVAAAAALQQLSRGSLAVQPGTTRQLCKVLKAVQASLQHGKAGSAAPIATLVPCMQALLSYGAEQRLSPLASQQRSPDKYLPPSARRAHHPTTSSDSESSDAEHDGSEAGQRGRVRFLALSCLQLLIKADPKALHPFWTSLLPLSDAAATNQGQPSSGPPSLANALLNDPSPRLRHSAAATLSTLLEGPAQRAFLGVAELRSMERQPVRGFVALSSSLGHAVVALHQALLHCLRRERDPGVRAAALRALSTLIAGAPYHRLPPQLLPLAVAALQACLQRAATPGQVATAPAEQLSEVAGCLSCLAAALGVAPPPADLADHLVGCGDGLESGLFAYARCGVPAVQLEAVLSLRGLAQQYHGLLEQRWDQVLGVGSAGAEVSVPSAQLSPRGTAQQESSLVERVAQQGVRLTGDYLQQPRGGGPLSAKEGARNGGSGRAAADGRQVSMWQEAMAQCFLPALLHASAALRAAAWWAVSGMPPAVVGALGSAEQAQILRHTCAAAATDSASPVRTAAAKALAALLGLPSMLLDTESGLQLAMGALHSACGDPVLAVRVQAAGALAAAGKALLSSSADRPPPDVPATIDALLHLALAACRDGEKVKAGGVQALGAVMAAGASLSGDVAVSEKAIAALLECLQADSPKVQWSACSAAGVFLRAAPGHMDPTPRLRAALAGLAEGSGNQRTRGLAAAALAEAGE